MSHDKRRHEMSAEEKQTMAEVNHLLFDSFKEHKKALYAALMKCGAAMSNSQEYYQCTDAIKFKEDSAEQRMREELTSYEVNLRL